MIIDVDNVDNVVMIGNVMTIFFIFLSIGIQIFRISCPKQAHYWWIDYTTHYHFCKYILYYQVIDQIKNVRRRDSCRTVARLLFFFVCFKMQRVNIAE